MPAFRPASIPYLQQLQVRRLSLGWHQLRQHLRHDLHVPIHHFQLTAQLPDLQKGGEVRAPPGKTQEIAEAALKGSALLVCARSQSRREKPLGSSFVTTQFSSKELPAEGSSITYHQIHLAGNRCQALTRDIWPLA